MKIWNGVNRRSKRERDTVSNECSLQGFLFVHKYDPFICRGFFFDLFVRTNKRTNKSKQEIVRTFRMSANCVFVCCSTDFTFYSSKYDEILAFELNLKTKQCETPSYHDIYYHVLIIANKMFRASIRTHKRTNEQVFEVFGNQHKSKCTNYHSIQILERERERKSEQNENEQTHH